MKTKETTNRINSKLYLPNFNTLKNELHNTFKKHLETIVPTDIRTGKTKRSAAEITGRLRAYKEMGCYFIRIFSDDGKMQSPISDKVFNDVKLWANKCSVQVFSQQELNEWGYSTPYNDLDKYEEREIKDKLFKEYAEEQNKLRLIQHNNNSQTASGR